MSPFYVSTKPDESGRITETTSGTLISRPIDKLPMGINVVGSEELKNLNIFNADSLAIALPGLGDQNQASTAGDTNNTTFTSRGFTVLPHINGIAPGGRLYDMTNVDRIEVISGPNSLLYGQSDPGGVINFITKRSTLRNQAGVNGDLGGQIATYNSYRADLDLDVTLVPGTLGVRLPVSYSDGQREFQYYRNIVTSINPSILWRIFPNTEVNFEYDYLNYSTNPVPLRPFYWTPPGSTPFLDINNEGLGETYNPYGPYAHSNTWQRNWFFDATTRIGEHITVHGIWSQDTRNDNDLVLNIPGGGLFSLTGPTIAARGLDTIDGNRIRDYKIDLLGEWNLGPLVTRTIAGYEFNDNYYHLVGSFATWQNGTSWYFNTMTIGYNPTTGLATSTPTASQYTPFPTPILNSSQWNIVNGPSTSESKWTNARVSEVLSAFDDRVQLLCGVAHGKSTLVNVSTGSTQGSSANVYQVGLGVAVDHQKQQMLYVNRSTSYQPDYLFDVNGNPLPATTASATEGGLKSTWGATGLSTAIVGYVQERVNVGRSYNDPNLGRSYGILTPGERSRGGEFQAWYVVSSQWSLALNYNQFKGEITGTNPGQGYLLGREIPRAPEKTGNVMAIYTLGQAGFLSHARFTLGARYASGTWLDTNEAQNTLYTERSSSATTAFFFASKEFKLSKGRSITVHVSVNNIFDDKYITEAFAQSEPCTVQGGIDYKF